MGIVGVIVSLAVATMSAVAPFVLADLQFIALPLFIFAATVAACAIGFGIWHTVRQRRRSTSRHLTGESKVGDDSVVIGDVSGAVGDRSVVVGATDDRGNTILNRQMAVGHNAHAGPGSIAIGAGASAGPGSIAIGAGASTRKDNGSTHTISVAGSQNVVAVNPTNSITAHTVAFEKPRRSLHDKTRTGLLKMAPTDKPVWVLGRNGDHEAMGLADEIYAFLKANGRQMGDTKAGGHMFQLQETDINVSTFNNGTGINVVVESRK